MTAMRLSRPTHQPAKDMESSEELLLNQVTDPELSKRKKKKKNKEKRKRSLSCSTESSSCSSSSKKHKKKKRKDSEDEGPTPRINPIFLRTHNDTNNTIVSVVCEDYDKWNRIKLTKTAGGWRAIPRTETARQWSSWDMLVKKTPPLGNSPVVPSECDKTAEEPIIEESNSKGEEEGVDDEEGEELINNLDQEETPQEVNKPTEEDKQVEEDDDSDVEVIPIEVKNDPVDIVDLCSDEEEKKENVEAMDDGEEDKEKCFENVNEPNLDENHNDFESEVQPSCLLEADDSVDKRLEYLFSDLEDTGISNVIPRRTPEPDQKLEAPPEEYLGRNCSALMDELEEMCHGIMSERLKIDEPAHKDDLSDIYTFVPTPPPTVEEKPVEEEIKTPDKEEVVANEPPELDLEPKIVPSHDSPINLVVQSNGHGDAFKEGDGAQLNPCELEGLDILWRLPEGTTIHHSKAPPTPKEELVVKPAHQPQKGNATISLVKPPTTPTIKEICTPVQEEPLNLGIPKPPEKVEPSPSPAPCKYEEPQQPINPPILPKIPQKLIKHDKIALHDSKLMELLNTKEEKCDPLAQLKEILNDPEVSVPDPLLVPRARLQALIANPAKEIPRLLIQSQQPKYPILDADLLVVSLAHLQFILQNGGKDEDSRLYQQAQLLQSQLSADKNCLDPAVLNQMLWLPYLSQLDLNRTTNPQELLAMMMSYNYGPWQQQHQQQHKQSYDYAQRHMMPPQWQGLMQKGAMPPTPTPKSYNDLYRTTTASIGYGTPPPLRPPPPIVSARPDVHHHRRMKHVRPPPQHHHQQIHQQHLQQQQQQQHQHRQQQQPQFRPPESWTIPQTSEASRLPLPPPPPQEKLPNTSKAHQSQPLLPQSDVRPKLKVRDHLIDPNQRPKLLKFDDPHFPPPPGSKFHEQNHPNLWHPLFSSQEGKSYTSPWQWTTPVTVSGE